MYTTLRKIGNSRGVIIPAALIEQLKMENEVELIVEGDVLIVKPVRPPRQGWFDGYNSSKDTEPLKNLVDLSSEQDDWEW